MRKFNHITISKVIEMIVVVTLGGIVTVGFIGFIYNIVTRGVI